MGVCRKGRGGRRRAAAGILASAMSALLAASLMATGCTGTSKDATASTDTGTPNPVIEQSATEIGTYDRIDPDKTQVVIGVCGSYDISAFILGFEEAYPDIQPIVVQLQIGNSTYSPASEWVKHGYAPDIVINLDLGSDTSAYQVDLTDAECASVYENSSLSPLAIDGRVYSLPGPSKVMGIAYNKTLFEQYGWQVPTTFDEFIALCDRITADTQGTVVPFNANAKYTQDYMVGLEGFSYDQLFGGVDNAAWYDGLLSGDRTFSGHMEPFFDMVQTMIDHKILTTDSFDYSYTTRTKEFLAGDIAMVDDYTDSSAADPDGFEVGFMPFPSTDSASQYLVMRSNFTVCETIRDRSEAQKQAADDFLNYISTPEAQEAYINGTLMVSHVTGVKTAETAGLENLNPFIDEGRIFERVDFKGGDIPDDLNVSSQIRDATLAMASGEIDSAQAVARLDETLDGAIADPESIAPAMKTLATVDSEFSVLQTSEYVADMFREITGADIALIPNNSIYRGNIHRMFTGDLTDAAVTGMLPRSFENGSTLVKADMTGEQLLAALNDPPDYNDKTADCIYAFSGLTATVSPCADVGSKYLSVTLSDGSEIDPAATYTVAFWDGMVRDSYITDIASTYEGSYTDLLEEKVASDGALTPADDGRLTLQWE